MVYLYQNSNNTVVTRFYDRRQRSDTYFLWEIRNAISGVVTYYITEDISPNSCSYNMFDIVHSTTGSDVGGLDIPISIEPGHNDYTVYETTELSIDMDKVIGVIEKDIMFVELIRGVNTDHSQVTNIYY